MFYFLVMDGQKIAILNSPKKNLQPTHDKQYTPGTINFFSVCYTHVITMMS